MKKLYADYTRAAERGHAGAQYSLGVSYNSGEGGRKDYKKAVYWYTRAAEQGHAGAQYSLGVSYDRGEGVEKDYEKAIYWYTKAAEQGNIDAQYNLALGYHYNANSYEIAYYGHIVCGNVEKASIFSHRALQRTKVLIHP